MQQEEKGVSSWRCLHVPGDREVPGDPDGFSPELHRRLYIPVLGCVVQLLPNDVQAHRKTINMKWYMYIGTHWTYLCLKTTASIRSDPGPALPMNSQSTPPQLNHPSMGPMLCFPNEQCNFNTRNLKQMILKIALPCPQAPEWCSHRKNQWK